MPDGLHPLVRRFGEHMQSCAKVLAALGIVRRGCTHRMWPRFEAMPHVTMKLINGKWFGVELAADLVERNQRVIAVKSRVFNALGRNRSADLLEFKRELPPLGRLVVRKRGRMLKQQDGRDKIEYGHRQRAIA